MSLHDDYARLTPFEIAFPDRVRFDRFVASVFDEAGRTGVDATDPDGFAALAPVGSFLAEQHGNEVPRVELIQHGVLLFHAVHFARAGCPLYLVAASAARALVRTAPGASPAPASAAGYLQLPQHLFWTAAATGAPPESLDGLFWTVSAGRRIHVLPIVGLRPDREGFGALSLPDAPLEHAPEWVRVGVRESGNDFASGLPGAELDELYAIEAAGEVLKLLARFFAHVATAPAVLALPRPLGPAGPRPSALAYTRVELVAQ